MPVPTAETYSFAEGKLYLYASASGTASGSGIGFAEGARLRISYGWRNHQTLDGQYHDRITGQRADLQVDHLFYDLTLFRLANASAAVNTKFEGLVTGGLGQSALWTLYSGVIDNLEVAQVKGDVFKGGLAYHANSWSALGQ